MHKKYQIKEEKKKKKNLSDFEFVKDVLKNLVVLDHLVLALGVEVDLVHRHHPWMNGVHQLAVDRTRTSLKHTDPPYPYIDLDYIIDKIIYQNEL